MTAEGKSRYDASSRRAASEQRRSRIVETAREQFLARGYAATTMAGIARAAGVNIDTVYELVGRKPELFALLVESAISGRTGAVPAEQRDYVREIHEQQSPEAKLAAYAAALPSLHARLAPLVEVLKEAGSSDPELAALWRGIEERRRANMARLVAEVAGVAEPGRLAMEPGMAADMLWATNSPEMYLLLVVRRGWTHDQYSQWLRDTWTSQLLGPAPRRARSRPSSSP